MSRKEFAEARTYVECNEALERDIIRSMLVVHVSKLDADKWREYLKTYIAYDYVRSKQPDGK